MYGSRFATTSTSLPGRFRASTSRSRAGDQTPACPSPCSAASSATRARTSESSGWNSRRAIGRASSSRPRKSSGTLSSLRTSSVQRCQEKRAASVVATAAAIATIPKAMARNWRICASRRSTQLMSWAITTKPSGPSSSAMGTAVTCTRPPRYGESKAHVTPGGSVSGPRPRTARQPKSSGYWEVWAITVSAGSHIAAPRTRSSWASCESTRWTFARSPVRAGPSIASRAPETASCARSRVSRSNQPRPVCSTTSAAPHAIAPSTSRSGTRRARVERIDSY